MSVAIEIDRLTKTFGQTRAVDGLSLCVRQGEIFGLLGPNGAGKSTTLYMCTGLVKPTSGTVRTLGHDVRRDFLHAIQPVGSLIEGPSFCEYLSARRNLEMLARLNGPGMSCEEAAEAVGLSERLGDRVRTYSHGMKQRLGIAQALLGEPRILLLDEPTSGLDPEGTRDLLALLKGLARDRGLTVVLSSHLLHEVEAICNRVAVIRDGRLVACSEVESLLAVSGETVRLRVDAAPRALDVLQREPYVGEIEILDSTTIEARLVDATPDRANESLVRAGVKVFELSLKRPTLQEFFFKVAGSDTALSPVGRASDGTAADPRPESQSVRHEIAVGQSWLQRVTASTRSELTKVRGQRFPYIVGFLGVAVVVVHFIGKRMTEPELDTNGFGFVVLSMQMSLALVGALFLAAFGATLMAGEISGGSVRLFLARPIRRTEYFVGKAVAALAVEVSIVVVTVIVSFAVAATFADLGDMVDGEVVIYGRGVMLTNLLLACTACVATVYASVSFGLMVSAWSRSVGAAVASTIGVCLFLDVAKVLLGIEAYVFTSYVDAPLVKLSEMTDGLAGFAWGTSLWRACGVCLVSAAVFLLVGTVGLCRRDLNE